MKKKVFFILSSLRAGGAERVFWLLSQNFDKSVYDVKLILLNSSDAFFSKSLDEVTIIDLETGKASKSIFKLYRLLVKEKPHVVFTTGGQINVLVAFISLFVKIPKLIARPTNQENRIFRTLKARIFESVSRVLNARFDKIICQSKEIRSFLIEKQGIPHEKLVVLPNPVVLSNITRVSDSCGSKRLIIVARLTAQKGIARLLSIMSRLPEEYSLTIVGDGMLWNEIQKDIDDRKLSDRVHMLGLVTNVTKLISEHNLFVLPSFIEGFPNVIIESLSVGTPVVSFEVGGISEIISDGFNGFIVKQGDINCFKSKIEEACDRAWDTEAIRKDIYYRFSIEKVTQQYEHLL